MATPGSDPPFAVLLYPGLDGWHWHVRRIHKGLEADAAMDVVVARNGLQGWSPDELLARLPREVEAVHAAWRRGEALPHQGEPHFGPWRSDLLLQFSQRDSEWYFVLYANVLTGHDEHGHPDIMPKVVAHGGPVDSLDYAIRGGVFVMNMYRDAMDHGIEEPEGPRSRLH